MTQYVRPLVEPTVFHDDAGNVIEYGDHWASRGGTPPDDSYSVVTHPERFAPLHAVATALIEHLASVYDLDIEEGHQVAADLINAPAAEQIVRAVRLTPRDEACAPLVFVLTDFPGVRLCAGVLFREAYPSCGCNACDERWEPLADELEWHTFSIVGGGFGEQVSEPQRARRSEDSGRGLVQGRGPTVSYLLRSLDGESARSGQSRADDVPPTLLEKARARLDQLAGESPDGGWRAWPRRDRGPSGAGLRRASGASEGDVVDQGSKALPPGHIHPLE